MQFDAAKLIANWFARHSHDGEFAYDPPGPPYSVIGPLGPAGRIVFTTKQFPVASAIRDCAECARLGMIARYGLPSDADADWIRHVTADHMLLFLGDLDPVDLLVFAWLRAQLDTKHVVHLGISDSFLAELRVDLSDTFVIDCSQSERESLPLLLDVFPDFRETVGRECADLLDKGRKIELEAVVSALGTYTSLLLPALKDPA
jgi:hypothetical protein